MDEPMQFGKPKKELFLTLEPKVKVVDEKQSGVKILTAPCEHMKGWKAERKQKIELGGNLEEDYERVTCQLHYDEKGNSWPVCFDFKKPERDE